MKNKASSSATISNRGLSRSGVLKQTIDIDKLG